MQAQDRKLGIIFEVNIRLMVPLFQRAYVWTEERNWQPLWEAIEEVANRRLQGLPPRPYFLGAIVLDQLRVAAGEVDSRQVIDGQQRLTTLQLTIAAIRDICQRLGINYDQYFCQLCQNLTPPRRDPNNIFKVWPTNVDRECFRQVMTAGSLDEVAKRMGKQPKDADFGNRIADCYAYFHNRIMEWLCEGVAMEDVERLTDKMEILYGAIRQDLVLVVVDLGEGDDPQLIFETLNALGTPLQPADLVKNFLFHKAEREKAPTDEIYARYWKSFDDDTHYWRSQVVQGRIKWQRIDMFLAHYLTLLRKDVVSMTHLFAEFRDHFSNGDGRPAEKQIGDLHAYAEVFRRFDQYPPDSRLGQFFHRLNVLDTNMAIPVLLEKLKNEQGGDIELFLDYLESYLVRRALCNRTAKGYNRIFVDMLRHLDTNGYTAVNLLEFLLQRKGESSEWPDDETFKRAFNEENQYRGRRQGLSRMVLEAIERQIFNAKSEQILIKGNLTIEHLMPQKWQQHWPMSPDATDEEKNRRERLVHTLGNLTLVTDKLNPSLSNAPWTTKKDAIQEHSVLTLNKRLCAVETWNEEAVLRRGEELFLVACQIWPRPVMD